ncbi:AraC family transcriptional regulator [Actinomadura flavalba]|uniref:AraC family transcriptional regulator n=1 Tax=Actinomadura flavalba TaxID=1120938 RepID=UPI00036B40D9|nr:AraC family transcriptional regulator [Actinomadura flavalba]
MDVLSDVISSVSAGRPHCRRVTHRAPFGQWFPAVAGAGFHLVLRGSCVLVTDDGAVLPLRTGDIVLLPSGRAHGLADRGGTPMSERPPEGGGDAEGEESTALLCGAYILDQPRPHPLLDDLPDVLRFPARIGRHPSLNAAVGLLAQEAESPAQGSGAAVPALLDLVLLYLLRAWFDERREDDGWAAALHDPAVTAALDALHGEPARPWTVADLGRRAGLSRAAFARRFTTTVGQPPLTYLTGWRMILAARLLREPDASLRRVALDVGYTSEFTFAHAFKREYGVPPGEYRRACRADAGAPV